MCTEKQRTNNKLPLHSEKKHTNVFPRFKEIGKGTSAR